MASIDSQGIIILGVPRSGTTLLRRLLGWHPQVHCAGETFALTAAARFLRSDTVVDGLDYGVLGGLSAAGIPPETVIADLRGLVAGYLSRLAGRAGKDRWACKTAIDSFYVAEIERLFAGHARFVCLLRHGLDVAVSLKDLCDANEIYLSEIHPYIVRYPRPFEAFAHLWAEVTTSLLDFAARNAGSVLTLRYESLVQEPDTALSTLLAFLELEPRGDLLEALTRDSPKGLGDWKTYGKTAVVGESLGRWKVLSDATIAQLVPVVNPVLLRAGYEPVTPGPVPTPEQALRRYELSRSLEASRSRALKDA